MQKNTALTKKGHFFKIAICGKSRQSPVVSFPPMNPSPSGDEELRIVQRDTPPPRLLETAASESDQPKLSTGSVDSGPPPPQGGRLTFVGSILLIGIAFTVGLSYLLEKRWLHHSSVVSSETTSQSGQANEEAEAAAGGATLTSDLFHVTAISLGSTRLAIVNGKKVAEGETVVVSTASGPATVRVAKIEDGVVHFVHGRERIDVQVNSSVAQKNPL